MNKIVAAGLCVCLCAVWIKAQQNQKYQKYSNVWVAKIIGGEEVAQNIARDLGYTYKGQCGQFEDYYEIVREDHPEMSLRDSSHLSDQLMDLDEVVWAGQQKLVRPMIYGLKELIFKNKRRKLNTIRQPSEAERPTEDLACDGLSCIIKVPTSILVYFKSFGQGDLSKLGTFPTQPVPSSEVNPDTLQTTISIGLYSKKLSAYAKRYTDPYWKKQWYMQDYRTVDMPVMDHNVVPAHNLGYTGKGVTVAVVDDGIEHDNPEYKDNFIVDVSYDTCQSKHGSNPKTKSSHGTSCAGVIAMKPNNSLCGVGIAYDANIVGIRAICEKAQTDSITAQALIHNLDKIDIYSSSWGSYGLGTYITVMDHMTMEALMTGASKGRNGKGSIHVKCSGNERDEKDNCATDHEINNPFVIGIAGADQMGKVATYSEACTAVFATAYTQNLFTEGIVAPTLKGGCETEFSGTSASAPIAAGIIALALEANPSLTYRDVMHLITMSSEVAPLANNGDTWYRNGRGFWVSNDFGFGLMNAENMVTLAKDWQTVPEQSICIDTVTLEPGDKFSSKSSAKVTLETTACQGSNDEVNYLEHIEVLSKVVPRGLRRGDIIFYITSPAGTRSLLLPHRPRDRYQKGLNGWSIMSTHNWGENPRGQWIIEYQAISSSDAYAFVREVTVRFFGTKEAPNHLGDNKKRDYAAFRLPNGKTSLDTL